MSEVILSILRGECVRIMDRSSNKRWKAVAADAWYCIVVDRNLTDRLR